MGEGESFLFSSLGSLDIATLFTVGGLFAAILVRVLYVMRRSGKSLKRPSGGLSILVVLGSGGHTAEMLNLLSVVEMDKFKMRHYIAAATDNMSLHKARVFEESLASKILSNWEDLTLCKFIGVVRPNVILCNGPGTCVPLCAIAFLFKILGIRWSSIFYVESIARVRKLSLSGLLLYKLRIADQLFVQWPQLKTQHPRANYVGRLM